MEKRAIVPGEARAWSTGRWGPRRVRVSECWAVITAEIVYDALLRQARRDLTVCAVGRVTWRAGDRSLAVSWESRRNRIWRYGRVLLRCPSCDKLATRLYLPAPEAAGPACRACWGLTYDSRQANYKDTGPLRQIGVTPRSVARIETWRKRTAARRSSRARMARRWRCRSGGTAE